MVLPPLYDCLDLNYLKKFEGFPHPWCLCDGCCYLSLLHETWIGYYPLVVVHSEQTLTLEEVPNMAGYDDELLLKEEFPEPKGRISRA